jgi:hypothetical protein
MRKNQASITAAGIAVMRAVEWITIFCMKKIRIVKSSHSIGRRQLMVVALDNFF